MYTSNNEKNSRVFAGIAMVACFLLVFTSCKKEVRVAQYPASVTFVNGLNDNSSSIRYYFGEGSPKYFKTLVQTSSGFSHQYGTEKTDLPVQMFFNADTLQKEKPGISNRLRLESGSIYTHFVYGSITGVKEKTVRENIPGYSAKDSVTNIRIINLFENRSVDVLLIEPDPKTIATDLKYEALTDFLRIRCTGNVPYYTFQVKDHATGTLLTTFTRTNAPAGTTIASGDWLFRSKTLMVTGKWNSVSDFNAKSGTISHF